MLLKINKIIYLVSVLFVVTLLTGCDDDIVYEESKDVASIYVEGINDNMILVHTGETYQVKMNVLPPDAQQLDEMKYMFSSGNEKVFTVNPDGIIQGVSPGEAVLYVEASNVPGLKAVVMVSVTDRVYPITEIKVDERLRNFFMFVNEELDMSQYVQILPENASNPNYILESSNGEVLETTESTVIKALSKGEAVLRIKAADESGVVTTCNIVVKEPTYAAIDRSAWLITPSHELPTDNAIKNAPESVIDGNISTCLSMVKPGKSYSGVSVKADENVFFVIDMKEKQSFDYLKLSHRTSNSLPSLRIWEFSLYGSDDGVTFVSINENVNVQYEGVSSHVMRLIDKADYRYVKVLYTDWDRNSGSTIQIAEVELGILGFE